MAGKGKRRIQKRGIDREELGERLRAGYTESAEELAELQSKGIPSKTPPAHDIIMQNRKVGRVPVPTFVGENIDTGFVRKSQGRDLGDVMLHFSAETVRAMQAGMICMKCLEPQTHAFADQHIEGCEGVLVHGLNYMKEHQILDFTLEFEGETHIGPTKPLREYVEEQELRIEKRRFAAKIAGGASRMRGLRRGSKD